MFTLYTSIKLFATKHFVSNSARLQQQSPELHALLRIFENSLSVSYFSTAAHVKNVALPKVSRKPLKYKKKLSSVEELEKNRSFTVSYLKESLGFSPEKAARACSFLRLKNSENANSVLALFRKYGFSEDQIGKAVFRRLGVLLCEEQTIVPKLEFFLSVGVSNDLLGAMVAKDPTWLMGSLEDTIIPNYKFIKSILLTDERAISTIKNHLWLLLGDIEECSSPKVKVLKDLKVPDSNIRYLVGYYPEVLFLKCEFEESVSKVLEMGFDPLKMTFVLALHAISGNKAIWDKCYETYSKWGWSKEDIYMAFRKHPNCMIMSPKKINEIMEILIHKIGWNPKTIAQSPGVLLHSLKKRIIPRSSVIHVLLSEKLIDKQYSLQTVFRTTEKWFVDRFIVNYEDEVPVLKDIYEGKIKVVEVEMEDTKE